MKTYVVERTVAIAAPIEAVFDFHLDFKNLALISPSWMKADLIDEKGAGLGKLLKLKVLQFGVFPSTWIVRIEEYEPPFRLTDLVLSGPLPYFRHTRTFSQPCAALTELHDKLEYALPFGFLGRIANRISVGKMMEDMFEHRHRVTKDVLEEKFYIKEVPVTSS